MDSYNEILKSQTRGSLFAICLILALAITVLVLAKRGVFNDLGKIGKAGVVLFVAVVVVLAGAYFSGHIIRLQRDINDGAYVTYRGEFEVSSSRDSYVTLPGEIRLDGRVELPGGEHSGTIIYGENSKYILDWKVD